MATQCTFGHFLDLGLVFKLLSLFCITASEIYSVVSNRFKTLEFLEFSGFHAEKSQCTGTYKTTPGHRTLGYSLSCTAQIPIHSRSLLCAPPPMGSLLAQRARVDRGRVLCAPPPMGLLLAQQWARSTPSSSSSSPRLPTRRAAMDTTQARARRTARHLHAASVSVLSVLAAPRATRTPVAAWVAARAVSPKTRRAATPSTATRQKGAALVRTTLRTTCPSVGKCRATPATHMTP